MLLSNLFPKEGVQTVYTKPSNVHHTLNQKERLTKSADPFSKCNQTSALMASSLIYNDKTAAMTVLHTLDKTIPIGKKQKYL